MEDWNNQVAAAYRAEGASDYWYQITKPCTLEHVPNSGTQWYQWNGRTNNGAFGAVTFDITAGGGCDPSQATPTGCPTPPGDICKSRPARGGIMGSNLSICFQGCTYKPTNPLDGMDGGLRTCVAGVGGACSTQASYKPTGGTCGDGPGTDTTPPPPPPAMPKLCGGGSCYDPNTGKGCALDANGNQVCMDVKPGAPGGCISSGETTLCSGNPPPIPPQDKVPDPPSDIVGSDNYGQQPIDGSGGGGSINNTTINNYNNGMSGGDGTPNNGGTAGDSGTPTGGDPAPGSSTGGPPTTSSGGGNCGTPPLITGDPAAQQIAYQAWATRCAIERQGDGLGKGTVNAKGTLYTPSTETMGQVVANFQASVQDAPIGKAMTGFFTVTSTGGACPVWTLPSNDWLPEQTFDFYCRAELSDLLDGARIIILIVCAFVAFRIAMGDS